MTPEAKRAARRRYYLAHRDELIAKQKARYRANRDMIKGQIVAWQDANRERLRETNHRNRVRHAGVSTCDHVACAELGPIQLAWQTNPHRCYLCGVAVTMERGGNLDMDHVVPISKGGVHCALNIRPACRDCHARKGAKLLVAS